MRKKKIFFQSDFSLIKTGFARSAKALLSYLYKTGKYDIVHYCVGMDEKSADLLRTPWKSIGCLPNAPEKRNEINKDPHVAKIANYGAYYLDEAIAREKPDVYIAAQDIWGVDFAVKKHWFNKITSVIWTTLDSLPLLPSSLSIAPKVKNYWIWSDFATKEMHRLGHKQVKTMHGIIDTRNFHRLSEEKRKELRAKNNIEEDAFIIGYVFRNQMRKSVPNLIEAFKLFKKNNPNIKNAKLLFHTDFREGWDIKRLAEEHGVEWSDILTPQICSNCLNYEVKPFEKPNSDCSFCGAKNTVNTTGVALGVTESQLNEIYNLMDVYCHPFTSGGQEIPVQEAKLAELITLVTNYSCGEEMCSKAANSLPLNWSEYREFGTNFIKASTDPVHIATQLFKVYSMDNKAKDKMGKAARNWALQNFSVESVGKKIEKFLDSCKFIDQDKYPEIEKKNPNAEIPKIENNGEWIKTLYSEILKTEVDDLDDGYKYWMSELDKGASREKIEEYFRGVATKSNTEEQTKDIKNQLSDNKNRILYVIPENEFDVFISTSLFESIKELYPKHDLYVATNDAHCSLLYANDHVHKVLSLNEQFNNLENFKDDEGNDLFETIYTPSLNKSNYQQITKTNICYK